MVVRGDLRRGRIRRVGGEGGRRIGMEGEGRYMGELLVGGRRGLESGRGRERGDIRMEDGGIHCSRRREDGVVGVGSLGSPGSRRMK